MWALSDGTNAPTAGVAARLALVDGDAGQRREAFSMMWHVNGMGGGLFPFMIVYPLFVIGMLALGLVWLARSSRAHPTPPAHTDTPQLILAERYARGELTDDEYRARLTVLRQS
jgi:putative membrane protein